MKRILNRIEKLSMAVAFAEAGEPETAMRMADTKPFEFSGLKRFLNHINCNFAAIAFAEENCHQWADPGTYRDQERRPASLSVGRLGTFLRDVGLQNVRVQYAVALI